ncbi:hypothetical protein ACOSQ3_032425 [Xanthoceras sorbifolium]
MYTIRTQKTTLSDAVSVGEKARNMRAAMIPTGKNSSINGGGGSGGRTSGSTTIDAATAASTTMLTRPKHFAIVSRSSSLPSSSSSSSNLRSFLAGIGESENAYSKCRS